MFQRQAIDSRLCRTTRQRGYIYDLFFHSLRSIRCSDDGENVYMVFDRNQREYSEYLPFFQKVVYVGALHVGNTHASIYVVSTTKMADRYLFLFFFFFKQKQFV